MYIADHYSQWCANHVTYRAKKKKALSPFCLCMWGEVQLSKFNLRRGEKHHGKHDYFWKMADLFYFFLTFWRTQSNLSQWLWYCHDTFLQEYLTFPHHLFNRVGYALVAQMNHQSQHREIVCTKKYYISAITYPMHLLFNMRLALLHSPLTAVFLFYTNLNALFFTLLLVPSIALDQDCLCTSLFVSMWRDFYYLAVKIGNGGCIF